MALPKPTNAVSSWSDRWTDGVTHITGGRLAFTLKVAVTSWLLSGPLFHWSTNWHLDRRLIVLRCPSPPHPHTLIRQGNRDFAEGRLTAGVR